MKTYNEKGELSEYKSGGIIESKYSAGIIRVPKEWLKSFYEIERELLIKHIESMLAEPKIND